MFRHTTALSVLALAAVSAPYVCQAQDPAGKFKRITQLQEQGKVKDALAQCDEMLKYFANKKSRTVAQYGFYEPFFVWKKGELLLASKEYDKAYEVYESLTTNAAFQDKNMRDKAKRRKLLNGQGYDPYLTAAKYYMALCRYQQGVGDAKKGVAPDPKAFEGAIPLLEAYLDEYQKPNGVSKMEKDLKLDGQICFMLMQSYILCEKPDFKKAGSYLDRGRKSKGVLPDEMAMAGLATVINVAMKNPETVGWVRDIIVSNPQSFSLGPVRMAQHGAGFLKPAQDCSKRVDDAIKKNDMKAANDNARSSIALLGMVPNMQETVDALKSTMKVVGSSKSSVVTDRDGVRYNGGNYKIMSEKYADKITDHVELDAYATQLNSSIALSYGSFRLAKAGYHILVTRYPDLQTGEKGKYTQVGEKLKQAYAQLHRATGDEAAALALEGKLDVSQLGEGALSLILNRMAAAFSDKKWEDTLKYSREVIAYPEIDKTSGNYLQARMCEVQALRELKKNSEAVTAGEKVLSEGVIDAASQVDESTRTSYDKQLRQILVAMYFGAVREAGVVEQEMVDKILNAVKDYETKYPTTSSEDQFLPHIYYYAVNTLLLRSSKDDFPVAQELCGKFIEHFKKHENYPTVLVLNANIIFGTKDKPKFEVAVRQLEEAYKTSLARPEGKGKGIAGEALNKLAVNGRMVNLTGDNGKKEDDAAKNARWTGYMNTFWEQVDAGSETNRFALQMARLALSDAAKVGGEPYEAAVKRAEDTIIREAAYAHAQSKLNPDVSKTITSLVSTKVEKGEFANLEARKGYITSLSSRVAKDDKFTQAALSMEVLTALEEAKNESDESKHAEFDKQIEEYLAQLARDYKAEDLTNEICYTIGEYMRGRAPLGSGNESAINNALDRAIPYYRAALKRGGSMQEENSLGLADALSAKSDGAAQEEAAKLYVNVLNSEYADFAVKNQALFGQARQAMRAGDYARVLDITKEYLEKDSDSDAGLQMLSMQAEAYEKTGKTEDAISIYSNMYRDYLGSIGVSAPACEKMMKLLWARGKGSYADNKDGSFNHSDKWTAWNRGSKYIEMVDPLSGQMSREERAAVAKVRALVEQYKGDSTVRDEIRAEAADRAKYQ